MAIKFNCTNPECGQKISCPDKMAGTEHKCPTCGSKVRVPEAEGITHQSQPQANRLGKNTIVRKIGQGGMGSVYEALQDGLERRVALKVLPKKMMKKPAQIERFRREAQAAGGLNHPNIVMVYESGEDQGYHYFSMEYVDGETLQDRLRGGLKLPIQEAIGIAHKIAGALNYAWNRGKIVHRDIKPANILLTDEGHVKLADLGLAKSTEEDTSVTQADSAMGTPTYMAPEQARNAKDVDCRADIYSLGLTLFRSVTGEMPYSGETALAVMMAHTEQPLPDARDINPEISEDLWYLISRMAAKRPEDRYQDYTQLVEDLANLENGVPLERTPLPGESEEDMLTIDNATAPAARGPQPAAARKVSMPLMVGMAFTCAAAVTFSVLIIARSLQKDWTAEAIDSEFSVGPSGPEETGPQPSTVPPIAERTSSIPGAAAAAERDRELREMYETALAYAADNPDNLDEAVRRLRKIEDRGKGTEHAKSARDLRTQLEGRAAEQKYSLLRDEISKAMKQSRYGRALKALSALEGDPIIMGNGLKAGAVTELKQSVQSQIRGRLAQMDSKAIHLTAEGKHDEARKVYEEIRAFGLPGVEDVIRKKLAQLDETLQEQKRERLRRTENLFRRACDRIAAQVRMKQYDGAMALCDELGSEASHAALRERLAAEKKDLARAKAGYEAILKAARAQVGKRVRIKGIRGKLKAVRGDKLVVTAGAAEMAHRVADLSKEDLSALVGSELRNARGETRINLAFYWGYDGDIGKARAELSRARLEGVDPEDYDHRIFPVLVVDSSPPDATVLVESIPWARPGTAGEAPPAASPLKAFAAPARRPLPTFTTCRVQIRSLGYRSLFREFAVANKGTYSIEAKLSRGGLPEQLYSNFEEAQNSKDQFGNPVRVGWDERTGYPLEIRHRKSGLDFVFVPAGSFYMGSMEFSDTQPVHKVAITNPFYMGKYEVTVGQFRRFTQQARYRTLAEKRGPNHIHDGLTWKRVMSASWQSPQFGELVQSDRHPAVLVARADIGELLNWLNGRELRAFAYPTEAQWEYACRGGTQKKYPWGDDLLQAAEYANVYDQSNRNLFGARQDSNVQVKDRAVFVAPVGSYKPNPFGLYDMIGNVYEKCADGYDRFYYARSPQTNPFNPFPKVRTVERGGSWCSGPLHVSCANRAHASADFRSNVTGFRALVKTED